MYSMTRRVSCDGVEAPLVTPTFWAPLSQARSRSSSPSTREAGLLPRFFTTSTKRREVEGRGPPTPITTSTSLVALAGEIGDQLVRPDDVRARGVDCGEASLDRALFDLGRNSVRGEDHRAVLDLVETCQAVGRIDQRDPLRLEIVCRVRVVNQHAEHVHRPIGLFAHPLGDPERIDHAVAVAARGDPDDFHGYRVYADPFLSIC